MDGSNAMSLATPNQGLVCYPPNYCMAKYFYDKNMYLSWPTDLWFDASFLGLTMHVRMTFLVCRKGLVDALLKNAE